MRLLQLPDFFNQEEALWIYDHFPYYVTADLWTSVISDSGTITVGDAAGGILAITSSDGTAPTNDESYLKTTKELFKFLADRPIIGEAFIQFTEANTDDANVFMGFADAIAADTLVDSNAGLKTSFSGACIYKVGNSTVWKCVSSVGTTQTISTSTKTAGGASYQKLRIHVSPQGDGTAIVTYYVNDQPLEDANIAGNPPITHTVSLTSATEMNFGFGVKSGGANTETLNIDWARAAQGANILTAI